MVIPGGERVLNVTETAGADALAPVRAASLLPDGLLADDEVVILVLRPSLLFIPLASATSLALIGLVAFLLAYLAQRVASWAPSLAWSDTQVFTVAIVLVIGRLFWQGLEWYGRVYVLTDRRVIRRVGVLRVAVFQTHLRNVQHTSVFTRLRERLFGLGTIGFATAGSDVFEAFWEMIRRPFAVHRTVVEAMQRYGGSRNASRAP